MKLVTHKSKNLLYCIADEGNVTVQFGTSYAVATQRTADSASVNTFKIQGWDGTKYTGLAGASIAIGKLTTTFTTPSTTGFKLIRFGLNGASIDTLCRCNMDLKPSTTYTFTCNFTNITQGSISWKDMMLVEGSTAGDYEPYSYNLLDKWQYPATQTVNGVTFTNNGDGTIVVDGTATDLSYYHLMNINFLANNKYLLKGCPSGGNAGTTFMLDTGAGIGNDIGDGVIGTVSSSLAGERYVDVYVRKGYTANNLVFKSQLYDLTLMYGAGNEPTTVDQFYADYPMLKVAPLGFIDIPGLELKDKGIKRLRYATTTRNLFDINKFGTGTASSISIDGDILLNTIPSDNQGDTFAFKCTVSVKKNTNYIIGVQDRSYDIFSCYVYTDKLRGNRLSFGSLPLKFNSGDNESLVIGFYSIGSRRQPSVATWIQGPQIEEGSTATPYAP